MDFDKFSKDYNQILDENIKISGESSDYFVQYKIMVINNFFKRKKLNKNIKFLDLGCGIGKIEQNLLLYFPKSEIYGIDPSKESIKIALDSMKETKNISFLTYDGENIPFENNYFDVVLLSCVLHHIDPIKRSSILAETYRILKKGGYLFIFEHNPYNPLTRYVVRSCEFDIGVRLLNKKNCVHLVKKLGFLIIESRYIVFFPHFLNFLRKFEHKLGFCPLGAQYFVVSKK